MKRVFGILIYILPAITVGMVCLEVGATMAPSPDNAVRATVGTSTHEEQEFDMSHSRVIVVESDTAGLLMRPPVEERPKLDWNAGKKNTAGASEPMHATVGTSTGVSAGKTTPGKSHGNIYDSTGAFYNPEDNSYSDGAVNNHNEYYVYASEFVPNLEKAEDGDSDAMLYVAECYEAGVGAEKDLRRAWEWYAKAAEAGNVDAQYIIGTLYRDAVGTNRNYTESAYWFRKAASHGHMLAQLNIARQFAEGKGVLQDYRIAAENYWRAAENGSPEGAFRFATMLRDGIGMEKDPPRALKYFNMAADGNYPDARYQAEKLIEQGVRPQVEKRSPVKKGGLAAGNRSAKKTKASTKKKKSKRK